MKKIIYLTSVLILLIIVSCNDFLTLESPDQLTEDNFWKSQSDAEAGLAAAYSQLEYSIDTWEFAEVKWPVEAYREDIIAMGKDASNYPNWTELVNFTYTNGNSQINLYWRNNYDGISFANQVIEKVNEIPETKMDANMRKQIVNEAHFLRGYYHLKLILNWEKIIVRDKFVNNQAALKKPLSSRTAAWDFILNEFKLASELPSSQNKVNLGRATSGAAYAYLGFVYLTRAYEEPAKKEEYLDAALKAFDQVKGYNLEANFTSMFNGSNKNCKESIFELQFSMSTANGADYRTQLHRWIGVEELWGWDEILPSEFLMDQYMKEGGIATTGRYDSRLYASIFFQCDYFNNPDIGGVYGDKYDNWFGYEDKNGDWISYNRPAFRKFMPASLEALSLSRCAINIPLMRYANVLLMKAEVLNELNRPLEAIPLINEVRSVHGDMPAMQGNSQEEVRKQIEHERILEFPLENYRWYDLRRWGKLEEAMTADGRSFDKSKHSFYPIPLTELNANDQIVEN